MQPMDNQPEGQPPSQQPGEDVPGQQEQASESIQEIQQEETQEQIQPGQILDQTPQSPHFEEPTGSDGEYRAGASEHIPFSFPSEPEPYQPMAQTPEQGWAYPPQPEYYQAGAFGQPPQRTSITQPMPQLNPGQYQQPPMAGPVYGAPYQPPMGATGPFYQQPVAPTHQPGLSSANFFAAQAQAQATPIAPRRSAPRGSRMRTGAVVVLVVMLAAVFASGLVSGWALSHNNTTNSSSNSSNGSLQPGKVSTTTVPQLTSNNADQVREAVINKAQPGVVQIDVLTATEHALGSGVIIDGRGYIVTNDHVVTGANSIEVTLADGTQLTAKVAGIDAADDLAVIKITPPASGLTVVSFGDSSQLKVGQAVLAMGSPLGNSESVTSGIISALNRNVSEGTNEATLPDAIQTDAPINPGNSGGALVDLQGNLVGIPTLNAIDTEFNTPANGLGFAIPSNRIKAIVLQIIADSHVIHTGRPLLGVGITDVDQSVASENDLSVTSGALIKDVTPGSPAATAGLRENDVIVQLGNAAIHNTADVGTLLLQHKPGEVVALKIYRGSQQLTINVTLGELAAN